MKNVFIMFLLCLLISPAYAIKTDLNGFRNLKWGDRAESLTNAHCENYFNNAKLCTVKNDNLL